MSRTYPRAAVTSLVAIAGLTAGCVPSVTVNAEGGPVKFGSQAPVAPTAPEPGEWHGTLREPASGGPALNVRMIVDQTGGFTASVVRAAGGSEAGVWSGSFDADGSLASNLQEGKTEFRASGTVTRTGERIVGVLTLTDNDDPAGRRAAVHLDLRRGPAPSPGPEE